jgi:hypothetical protein
MPESLIPISHHFAVWDVHRGRGWVSLYARGRTVVANVDVDDIDDFDVIIAMLADRRGLCFDSRREVLMRVAEPVHAGVDGGASVLGRG